MRVLEIQNKNSLNMKIAGNYLNSTFHIEVKTKSKYKTIKNTKRHFGCKDEEKTIQPILQKKKKQVNENNKKLSKAIITFCWICKEKYSSFFFMTSKISYKKFAMLSSLKLVIKISYF